MPRWGACVSALLAVLVLGCTTFSGVNDVSVVSRTNEPTFQRENLPVRTVRVVVLTDSAEDWFPYYNSIFYDASNSMEQQVGIRMEVTLRRTSWGKSRSLFSIHQTLRQFRETHRDFDIIIGFALDVAANDRWCAYHGSSQCSVGWTQEGRNIALHTLSVMHIAHEVGHTFIGIRHSPKGLMEPIPVADGYFLESDRKRVLKNKWKDFSKRPNFFMRCFSLC